MENKENKTFENIAEVVGDIFKVDQSTIERVNDLKEVVKPLAEEVENVVKEGISFENSVRVVEKTIPVIEKTIPVVQEPITKIVNVVENAANDTIDIIKKKVESISIGKNVTIIHGDFDNQKVLKGKLVSTIGKGLTVIDQNEAVKDPVVVQFDKIIDIFEVKKFKKEKEEFSIFKMNKKIREFFTGNDEEIQHAYEQKITVKKLRDELKKKNKETK